MNNYECKLTFIKDLEKKFDYEEYPIIDNKEPEKVLINYYGKNI